MLSDECLGEGIEPQQRPEPLAKISKWFEEQVWPWEPKPKTDVDRRLVEGSGMAATSMPKR
jgi:hypothetical protein